MIFPLKLNFSKKREWNTPCDMEKFRSESWNRMSAGERISLLQQFGDEYAHSIGLDELPRIVRSHDSEVYGMHCYEANTIGINLENCSNPYKAMETVVHEENHAFQNQCVAQNYGYTDGELALLKAQTDSAIYYGTGDEYRTQNIELDSNNVSTNYVLNQKECYQNDPAYYEYLDMREAHYSEVNELLENNVMCNISENNQVMEAYEAGLLSDAERGDALAYIGENCRTRQESIDILDSVQEAQSECALDYASDLHTQNENLRYAEENSEKDAQLFLKRNESCIDDLERGRESVEAELQNLRETQRDYITENNYGFSEVEKDPYCQQMRTEIAALEQKMNDYQYHTAELSTDMDLIQNNLEPDAEMKIDTDVNENLEAVQATDVEMDVDTDLAEDQAIDVEMDLDTNLAESQETDVEIDADLNLDLETDMLDSSLDDGMDIDLDNDLDFGISDSIDMDGLDTLGDITDSFGNLDDGLDMSDSISDSVSGIVNDTGMDM